MEDLNYAVRILNDKSQPTLLRHCTICDKSTQGTPVSVTWWKRWSLNNLSRYLSPVSDQPTSMSNSGRSFMIPSLHIIRNKRPFSTSCTKLETLNTKHLTADTELISVMPKINLVQNKASIKAARKNWFQTFFWRIISLMNQSY